MPFLAASIPSKLTHTVIRQKSLGKDADGTDKFGEEELEIACLIDGSTRLIQMANGNTIRADFDMLFLPDQEITVGDKLTLGTDQFGNVIFQDVRVLTTDVIIHPRHGKISVQASVKTGV